jgi:hypothetical protein
MHSRDYKAIITQISFNLLKKRFPSGNKHCLKKLAGDIALNIHARMYGANVDGVDSPIWSAAFGFDRNNDPRIKPNVDAKDILNDPSNNVDCECKSNRCEQCSSAAAGTGTAAK